MNKEVIVFDFDKTLTYKDTLLGFFLYSSSKTLLFPFKVFFYYILMICARLKLITNSKLKEYGIRLFLFRKSRINVQKKSAKYAEKIRLNKLFDEFNFNRDIRIYIVSASFEDYLKIIFPDHVNILASQIKYSNDRVCGLQFNCYRENKVDALAGQGIAAIDLLYTDSYSDYPLAKISKKIIIVRRDELYECDSIKDFNRSFGK